MLGAETAECLEITKHFLWQGNVDMALERLDDLSLKLYTSRSNSPVVAKMLRSVAEFKTYIRNNRAFIPNFGERYRLGDVISTAFGEVTINQVVSKRIVKKLQMQWTPKGAHLLLQTRRRVPDDLEVPRMVPQVSP